MIFKIPSTLGILKLFPTMKISEWNRIVSYSNVHRHIHRLFEKSESPISYFFLLFLQYTYEKYIYVECQRSKFWSKVLFRYQILVENQHFSSDVNVCNDFKFSSNQVKSIKITFTTPQGVALRTV